MASSEPMPRYFFSLIPSEKKYSPGASVVAARREPIITSARDHQEQRVSSRKAPKPLGRRARLPDLCCTPLPTASRRCGPLCPVQCRAEPLLGRCPRGTARTSRVLTCGGPKREGLGYVPHCLDPSVCNHGDAEPPGVLGHLVHRRGLGAAARQHYRWGESSKRGEVPCSSASPPQQALQACSTHMLQHSGTHKSPEAPSPGRGAREADAWEVPAGTSSQPPAPRAVVTWALGSLVEHLGQARTPGSSRAGRELGKEAGQTPKAPLQSTPSHIPPLAPSPRSASPSLCTSSRPVCPWHGKAAGWERADMYIYMYTCLYIYIYICTHTHTNTHAAVEKETRRMIRWRTGSHFCSCPARQ